jgi:hypothetical protein
MDFPHFISVEPALGPGIQGFARHDIKDVNGPDKCGHDEPHIAADC